MSLPLDLAAQTLTNEDIVSAQVGYAEGLLPSIQYLQWMFQTAASVAQKNAAVYTYQHFQMIDRATPKAYSPPVDPIRAVQPSRRPPRQPLSNPPWWHTLLGIQSSEKNRSDLIFNNLEVHPDFEIDFLQVTRTRDLLMEEITDSRWVDRGRPAYFFGRSSSLQITQQFFQTRMYLRESTGVSPDPFQNLRLAVDRFKESLIVIGKIFETQPLSCSKVKHLIQDYLRDIDAIEFPKSPTRNALFSRTNSKDQIKLQELRRKFSSSSTEMGAQFSERWGSLDLNKYFIPFPGIRSCLSAHFL